METAQGIALITFVLLAGIVVLAARRAGSALNRTRIAESFRSGTVDLDRRVGQSLGDIATLIDAVRRRESDPELIRDNLVASKDAVQRYAAELGALEGPPVVGPYRQEMTRELERVERALELVDHGCALARSGHWLERGPEADTSIKRGYLNLIHARGSFAEHAATAVRLAEEASPVRRFGQRAR